jgi:MSHA pilin protein MshD
MYIPKVTGKYRQSGISLVELIMFIIIVGFGVAGILLVMNVTTQSSTDPMLRKQALSIAESLLEEIQLQPFTYCDPTDDNVATATGAFVGAGGCATLAEGYGPEAGESRYSITQPFNNVNDYGGAASGATGFSMNGIRGLDNVAIAGLENYAATVTITDSAVDTVPAEASLRIDVRVTSGTTVDVTLTGYRMRYAPNAGL